MLSAGPNSPTVAVLDDSPAGVPWADVALSLIECIEALDYEKIACATMANPESPPESYDQTAVLRATGFGFEIPAGATILGVKVEIVEIASGVNAITDATVELTEVGSENKATTDFWAPNNDNYAAYGGEADLWGCELTPEIVNDADFGVLIGAKLSTAVHSSWTASIDHVRVTVYYEEAEDTGMYIDYDDVDDVLGNLDDLIPTGKTAETWVNLWIGKAQARVDAALRARYVLPLTEPYPEIVKEATLSLAIYFLLRENYRGEEGGEMSDYVASYRKEAEAMLDDIRDGTAHILDSDTAEQSAQSSTSSRQREFRATERDSGGNVTTLGNMDDW